MYLIVFSVICVIVILHGTVRLVFIDGAYNFLSSYLLTLPVSFHLVIYLRPLLVYMYLFMQCICFLKLNIYVVCICLFSNPSLFQFLFNRLFIVYNCLECNLFKLM